MNVRNTVEGVRGTARYARTAHTYTANVRLDTCVKSNFEVIWISANETSEGDLNSDWLHFAITALTAAATVVVVVVVEMILFPLFDSPLSSARTPSFYKRLARTTHKKALSLPRNKILKHKTNDFIFFLFFAWVSVCALPSSASEFPLSFRVNNCITRLTSARQITKCATHCMSMVYLHAMLGSSSSHTSHKQYGFSFIHRRAFSRFLLLLFCFGFPQRVARCHCWLDSHFLFAFYAAAAFALCRMHTFNCSPRKRARDRQREKIGQAKIAHEIIGFFIGIASHIKPWGSHRWIYVYCHFLANDPTI